jgi:hypothetical protein
MSPREKRKLQNEALFREVNERIAELEDRLIFPGDLLPLICECANTGCATMIEVEPATFQAVRANPMHFLVAPGHEQPEETVVTRGETYLVVEKPDPS